MTAPPLGSPPLLPTKLFVPVLAPDVLTRARLLETLSEGRDAGTILVSAPAGAGKTTLIATWAHHLGLPTGWLSLDPADDDPSALLGYLVEAVSAIAEGAAERASAMLGTIPPPDPISVAQALLADMAAAAPDGLLVVDDYHVVSHPAVHQILGLLVERAPACVTRVVITRSDPPLPLPRMRVRRQLCEIREADLRFDAPEAAEFVRRFCGHELRPASVEVLAARTEGWAAGLQLAGLALRSASDPDAFVNTFGGTHAFVADYLTDEVLASIPEERHRFVVHSALLDRLCAPLCDVALDTSGSQALLEELCRANLFLVPLDNERRWFRYHHLFRDLLRRHVQEESEAERREVLARAARWCAGHGAVGDAVTYAMRVGDVPLASGLVAQHGIQALAAGEAYVSLRWIRTLPDEVVRSSPDHCVIAAWSHSLLEAYEPVRGLAERALELMAAGRRPHPHVDDVELHARVIVAGADAMDDRGGGAPLREVTAVLAEAPVESLPVRASGEIMAGKLLAFHGDYTAALAAHRRARSLGAAAGSDLLRLAGVTGIAETLLLQGRLDEALATIAEELGARRSLVEILGSQVANLCALQALAFLERGDLDGAASSLRRCRRALGDAGDEPDHWPAAAHFERVQLTAFHSSACAAFHGLAVHVRLLLRAGETDAADRLLDSLAPAIPHDPVSPQRVLVDSLRARLMTTRGDRADLRRIRFSPDRTSTGCVFWNDLRWITAARAALGAGDAAGAQALMETLLSDLKDREAHLGLGEALVLHALAASERRHRDASRRSVDAALERTATAGRMAPWLEVGAPCVPLLEDAIARAAGPPAVLAHAVSLLAAFREGRASGSGSEVEPLSERELAVVRLLAAGRTNQEIANALFLAIGTVKRHTHNIYIKLGVSNRIQAVRAAQEHGLISPLTDPTAE